MYLYHYLGLSMGIGEFVMLNSLWTRLLLPGFGGQELLWLFLVANRESQFCTGNQDAFLLY